MSRLGRRLVRHHLPLGIATLVTGLLFYQLHRVADIIERLSFASAYSALILISATLAIGPLKLLGGRRVPISLDLRRDVGIWAGMTGVFHAVDGQCVHLRGRPWLYYIYENWRQEHLVPMRYDLFGFANYTGLIAALILLLLLCLSNDASLRKLGTSGWKKLQRWNYACFGLAAIHTFLYQAGLERQKLPFVAIAAVTVAFTLIVQYQGFRLRRSPPLRRVGLATEPTSE